MEVIREILDRFGIFFDEVFTKLFAFLETFFDTIIGALPTSPFREFIDNIPNIPYLPWLNWFFPISEVLIVMSAWLVAVGLFYLYSVIMRWIKVLGD